MCRCAKTGSARKTDDKKQTGRMRTLKSAVVGQITRVATFMIETLSCIAGLTWLDMEVIRTLKDICTSDFMPLKRKEH